MEECLTQIDTFRQCGFISGPEGVAQFMISRARLRLLYVNEYPSRVQIGHTNIEELGAAVDVVVEVASTVREALARLEQNDVDVILFDLGVPNVGGIPAFRRFYESVESIPIIVVTEDKQDGRGEEAISLGAQDFLVRTQVNQDLFRRSVSYAVERAQLMRALQCSHNDVIRIAEQNVDGIIVLLEEPREVRFANSAARRVLEANYITNVGKLFDVTFSGEVFSEVAFMNEDGSSRIFEVNRYTLEWQYTEVIFLSMHEITIQRGIEQQLSSSLRKYELLVDAVNASTVGILVVDATQKDYPIIYSNPYFETLTGYERDEILGKNCRFLQGPQTNLSVVQQIRDATMRQERIEVDILNYKKDRTPFWNHLTIDPVFDATTHRLVRFVGVQQDITAQRSAADEIERMAFTDPVTGTANMLYLTTRGDSITQAAILVLDLDNFGHINDAGGLDLGNEVLQASARRLEECLPEAIIGRAGGDEFAVILPGIDSIVSAEAIANRVLEAFRKPLWVGEETFYVTTSIGVYLRMSGQTEVSAGFRAARIACDVAKRAGRNRLFVASETSSIEAFKRATLVRDIRRALLLEEFEVYFQPRVHAFTGEIVSCEALLRWNHPEWGRVAPTDFIDIMEETGLITEVGDWVIGEVCRTIRRWDNEKLPPVKISFNTSPRQLLNRHVFDVIKSTIDATGIDASRLEMELTEDAVLEHDSTVNEVLRALKAEGIDVALDDFGRGYASLYELSQFNIQTIKIDKVFTHSLHENRSYVVVRHLISLARELGLRVVVEGVETERQLRIAREFGCDEIQGFYYSVPLPERDFVRLVKTGLVGVKNQLPKTNRRQFFRVSFKLPLKARMTIAGLGDKTLNLGYADILVLNMGPGGLKFLSNISLPRSPSMTLRFEIQLLENFTLLGTIVWGHEFRGGIYQYGVKFTDDAILQEKLSKTLNQLSLRMRHQSMVAGCDFVNVSPSVFFEGQG